MENMVTFLSISFQFFLVVTPSPFISESVTNLYQQWGLFLAWIEHNPFSDKYGKAALTSALTFLFDYEQIREYHKRNPSARVVDTSDAFEELLKEEPVIEFSGEVTSRFFFW